MTRSESENNPISKTTTPEKKKLTDKQKKLAAFILSGLILAGIVTGTIFETNKGKGQPIDNPTPTITEPSTTPTQTTTSPETSPTSSVELLPTVESLEIDASLISDPELLSKTFVDKLITGWFNAGATPENAEAALESGDVKAYATKISQKYDGIFEEAILIKEWQQKPTLVELVKNMRLEHEYTLEMYYKTYGKYHAEDKVPYTQYVEYTGVVSFIKNKDGSYKLINNEHQVNNSDQNRIGSTAIGGYGTDTGNYSPTSFFIIEDSSIKLSDYIPGSYASK